LRRSSSLFPRNEQSATVPEFPSITSLVADLQAAHVSLVPRPAMKRRDSSISSAIRSLAFSHQGIRCRQLSKRQRRPIWPHEVQSSPARFGMRCGRGLPARTAPHHAGDPAGRNFRTNRSSPLERNRRGLRVSCRADPREGRRDRRRDGVVWEREEQSSSQRPRSA
jgi:hypothetical protein